MKAMHWMAIRIDNHKRRWGVGLRIRPRRKKLGPRRCLGDGRRLGRGWLQAAAFPATTPAHFET